ncbi:DUF6258 family protein [Chondromyces crocatus]|nr:DUF6258 family protein [Chondromyces crocatus]AKT38868.1 uncharacterized protein CMC5_030140 [Chondromyces crocatus]
MGPRDFLKTVYLGDRGCKGVFIDSWRERVTIHVNVISRVRGTSGAWDYYTDEDITDGHLVFTGVKSICFEPSGPLPNDFIYEVLIEEELVSTPGSEMFNASISVGSVGEEEAPTEVVIKIQAKGLHLEDPARPGQEIRS